MDPRSWQVLLAGVLGQVAVAVAILGSAVLSGDRVGTLAGWYLVAFALVGAVVAAGPFVLLRYRRRPRLAAGLSVLVGLGILWVGEFAVATWVLPLSLFVAGALAWREGSARATDGEDPDRSVDG